MQVRAALSSVAHSLVLPLREGATTPPGLPKKRLHFDLSTVSVRGRQHAPSERAEQGPEGLNPYVSGAL
eukprot:4275541-Alexandrium_andersonii.AAC.1